MFTNFWERQIVQQLKAQERDEIIIHVSLEESIEAMAFAEYGRILEQRPADFARGKFTDWARMLWAKSQMDGVRFGVSVTAQAALTMHQNLPFPISIAPFGNLSAVMSRAINGNPLL